MLELFRHYLQQACDAHRLGSQELTREAEQVLLEYEWPGNVRELRNITERSRCAIRTSPLQRPTLLSTCGQRGLVDGRLPRQL